MYRQRSKFGVKTTKKGIEERTYQGIIFDSLMELRYYRDYLELLKAQGKVLDIILQPKYLLQSKFQKYGKTKLPIYYIADYEVLYADNHVEIIDVKGNATIESGLKRKLFDYKYPEKTLFWVSFSKGEWWDYDLLKAERRKNKKNKKV
jgi:hypothetical protein